MSNYKYDLYISLGEACSCSMALRNAKLQFYSYPLDWVGGGEFLGRTKFLVSDFENFIVKDDLEKAFEVRSISCQAYVRKSNKMVFNHDFKLDVPFDEMFEEVDKKYKRRAKRVLEQIKNSKSVLFVYLRSPESKAVVTDEQLIEAYEMLSDYFKDVKVDLLYVYCERGVKINKMKKYKLSENIRCCGFDYDKRDNEAPYKVQAKPLDMLFRHFSITDKHLTKENIKERNAYKRKMFCRGKLLFNPLSPLK